MDDPRPELNRLEVLRALRISNWEAVFATVHITLTGGAFLTGFALLLGANNFWMGVISSFATFAGLVQIVSSWFVERRGERKWFTAFFSGLGRTLWILILLLPFVLPSHLRFSAFLVLLLLSSVCLSIPGPAFTSWMSDLVPPDHRGRYFGRRNMLAGITTMVVSLPAAWFLDLAVKSHRFTESVGFAVLFGLAVVGGLGSFVCLLRQAEPPMRKSETEDVRGLAGLLSFYRAPFADRAFRRLLFYSGFFAAAQFFAAPFYIVYALQILKLNYVWIQVFSTLASLAGLLSMPLWGYLGDKFGNKPLLVIAGTGVGILPILWIFTSRESMVFSLVIICLNNLLGGLFWAGVGLAQFNLLIGTTPDARKSLYIGANSAIVGLAGGLAPILGGVMVTALSGVQIQPLGWKMGNYQIVFALNALLRFAALFALRRVQDESSAATAREVLTQIGAGRVGAWVNIRRFQRAQSQGARRQAMQALRSAKTTLAVEELIAALDDPSLHVREEAAETLGELGDPRAVDALIAHLKDAASGVVDEAAEALGRIGDDRAVAPLMHLLQTGEKPDRIAAVRALRRIGSPDAVPALLQVFSGGQEGSPEVMEACVTALGALGAVDAIPALMSLLPGAGRTLRMAIVRAFGDIGEASASEPLLSLLAVEEDPALIAYIAVALAMCGVSTAVLPLLAALERVESPVARKQILNAVGTLIDVEDTFYPLLALESFARDQAVSRLILDMARSEREEGAGLSERRKTRQLERALESYLAGDYSMAIQRIQRVVGTPRFVSAADVVEWAIQTMERRTLLPEEFLLTLCALRTDS